MSLLLFYIKLIGGLLLVIFALLLVGKLFRAFPPLGFIALIAAFCGGMAGTLAGKQISANKL